MFQTIAHKSFALATLLSALALLPACDGDDQSPDVRQVLEVDLDDETLDRLAVGSGVDFANDDFTVYAPSPSPSPLGDASLSDAQCADVDSVDLWEDACGHCTCMDGSVVCIDLDCNPGEETAKKDKGATPQPETPNGIANPQQPEPNELLELLCDDGEHVAGDAWSTNGIDCSCNGSGVVECTAQPETPNGIADPLQAELMEQPQVLCEDGEHVAGDEWSAAGFECACAGDGAVDCVPSNDF